MANQTTNNLFLLALIVVLFVGATQAAATTTPPLHNVLIPDNNLNHNNIHHNQNEVALLSLSSRQEQQQQQQSQQSQQPQQPQQHHPLEIVKANPIGGICFLWLTGLFAVLNVLVYVVQLTQNTAIWEKISTKAKITESNKKRVLLFDQAFSATTLRNAHSVLSILPVMCVLVLFLVFRDRLATNITTSGSSGGYYFSSLLGGEESDPNSDLVQTSMMVTTIGLTILILDAMSFRLQSDMCGNISQILGNFLFVLGLICILIFGLFVNNSNSGTDISNNILMHLQQHREYLSHFTHYFLQQQQPQQHEHQHQHQHQHQQQHQHQHQQHYFSAPTVRFANKILNALQIDPSTTTTPATTLTATATTATTTAAATSTTTSTIPATATAQGCLIALVVLSVAVLMALKLVELIQTFFPSFFSNLNFTTNDNATNSSSNDDNDNNNGNNNDNNKDSSKDITDNNNNINQLLQNLIRQGRLEDIQYAISFVSLLAISCLHCQFSHVRLAQPNTHLHHQHHHQLIQQQQQQQQIEMLSGGGGGGGDVRFEVGNVSATENVAMIVCVVAVYCQGISMLLKLTSNNTLRWFGAVFRAVSFVPLYVAYVVLLYKLLASRTAPQSPASWNILVMLLGVAMIRLVIVSLQEAASFLLKDFDESQPTEAFNRVMVVIGMFHNLAVAASLAELLCLLFLYVHFRAELFLLEDPATYISGFSYLAPAMYLASGALFLQMSMLLVGFVLEDEDNNVVTSATAAGLFGMNVSLVVVLCNIVFG